MGKVYVGQRLEIRLNTSANITGADEYGVLAIKPKGKEVVWVGTQDNETVVYTTAGKSGAVSPGDMDEDGMWRLQAMVTIGGEKIYGETAILQVYPLGS